MTTQTQFHAIFANPAGRIDLDELRIEFRSKSGQTKYKYYDNRIGSLYVVRSSIATVGFVRAQSWHFAYEILEDEFSKDLNGEFLDLATPELLDRLQIQIVIVNV